MVLETPTRIAQALPPLQNGDFLSAAEFEARWDQEPDLKRAELLEGRVYLDVTVSHAHARPHAIVMGFATTYWGGQSELEVVVNASFRMIDDNTPQPDVALRWLVPEKALTRVGDKNVLEGGPEFVFEVAVSSAARDLTLKKDIYRRNGVLEYVVWSLYEERIDWFALEGEEYVLVAPDANGIIESRVFPGLRLDVGRMLAEDLAGVLAALRSPQRPREEEPRG